MEMINKFGGENKDPLKNMDQALNKISLLLMNKEFKDQNQRVEKEQSLKRSINSVVLQNSTQKVLNTKEKSFSPIKKK